MDFQESLAYLLSLGHETLAIKLGLRNTELLLDALGNPHRSFEVIQIAGTNGKGSTAAMLASICRYAGFNTGLYTSPHLRSITERIIIDGVRISEQAFGVYAGKVRAAAESLLARGEIETLPTFFEHVTAIALLAFQEAKVTLAILETGLGGRLDATTVARAKTVGLTPVSPDHQEYLGETLAEIAFEKASIIRPGVTALSAPQLLEVAEVIVKRCRECGVTLVPSCKTFALSPTNEGAFAATFESSEDRYEDVQLVMRGRHQITNAALAIQLAEALRNRGFTIPKAAIVDGLQAARHEGRLGMCGALILLDGAHNPDAARVLREYLDEFVKGPLTLIFGAMKDKKLAEIAAVLFPGVNYLVLAQPDNPRAATVEQLKTLAEKFVPAEKTFAVPNVAEAIEKGREMTPPLGRILVTGSLYLIGEAYAALRAAPSSMAHGQSGNQGGNQS
jgi:dihydrofolate synthase/folylpolyglutamate synthase